MKILKPLSQIFLTIVGFTLLFSFSVNTLPKTLTTATYYYVGGTPYQRILWNTNNILAIERSIDKDLNTPPFFKRISSWTTSAWAFVPDANNTGYIGSLTFTEESTADGGSDGELTLQEAIDAMYNTYISTQAMPSSLLVDGAASISFIPSSTPHS